MTPEHLAEIKDRANDLAKWTPEGYADWALAKQDIPALIAEVERLAAQVAELEEDSAMLAALRAAGVDNWDGYSIAHEILDGWNGEATD